MLEYRIYIYLGLGSVKSDITVVTPFYYYCGLWRLMRRVLNGSDYVHIIENRMTRLLFTYFSRLPIKLQKGCGVILYVSEASEFTHNQIV